MLPDDNHDADGAQDDAVVDHGVGTPDRLQRLWAPYRMSYIAKGVQDSHSATVGRDPFVRGAENVGRGWVDHRPWRVCLLRAEPLPL